MNLKYVYPILNNHSGLHHLKKKKKIFTYFDFFKFFNDCNF